LTQDSLNLDKNINQRTGGCNSQILSSFPVIWFLIKPDACNYSHSIFKDRHINRLFLPLWSDKKTGGIILFWEHIEIKEVLKKFSGGG
jgi:hypothetical protein